MLRFPLVRLIPFFIGGIVAGHYFPVGAKWVFPMTGAVICLAILLRNRKPAFFAVTAVALAMLGMLTETVHDARQQPHHFTNLAEPRKVVLAKIVIQEKRRRSAAGERFVAHICSINGKASTGEILLYAQGFKKPLYVGQTMTVFARLVPYQRPLNPNQFDYGKYLENQSIYGKIYLKPTDIVRYHASQRSFWFHADGFRRRIIRDLSQTGFNDRELQVAHALILGQQQDIDPAVMRDYQFAGAVHILSVSGLHVGFVLLIVNFFLRPLPNHQGGRLLKLVLGLAAIWGFAAVSGLSPSVVRAAVMFSFVAVGSALSRSSNVFHTLIVSAFLILLFRPSFLFDVGFQLSYAALFFILWLQPVLDKLWTPRYKVVRYFWNILTVSLAAQIGTLPLALYYFHQFPGLFFVTNLVVLPLLGVIMPLGVVVMLLAWANITPEVLSELLEQLIWLMNATISKVAAFDGWIFQNVPMTAPMMVALFATVIALSRWLVQPGSRSSWLFLTTVCCFQLLYFEQKWRAERTEEFLVFDAGRKSAIAAREGKKISVLSGLPWAALQTYATANFCGEPVADSVSALHYFKGTRILIADSATVSIGSLHPEVLVLTGSPHINLDRVAARGKPRMVIADGSNFKSYVRRWEITCREQKIPFHYTREKGFFRLRF
jgi:competence protein ComEC